MMRRLVKYGKAYTASVVVAVVHAGWRAQSLLFNRLHHLPILLHVSGKACRICRLLVPYVWRAFWVDFIICVPCIPASHRSIRLRGAADY